MRAIERAVAGGQQFGRGVGLGLLHALLMLAAFAGVPRAIPFACVAIMPLVIASTLRTQWRGAAGIALGSSVFWAVRHLWLADVTLPGLIGMVPILAALPAAFVWLLGRLRERADARVRSPWLRSMLLGASGAILWTGLEVFRGEVMAHGYPWYLIGQPLIDSPALARPAAWGSVYLVSLLVALMACGLVEAVHAEDRARTLVHGGRWKARSGGLLVCAAAVIVWTMMGIAGDQSSVDVASEKSGFVRVGVVQTNLPQDNKLVWELDDRARRLEEWLALSERCASEGASLIVWPETMYPGFVLEQSGREAVSRDAESARRSKGERAVAVRFERIVETFAERFLSAQSGMGVPMLVGATGFDGLRIGELPDGGLDIAFDATFNSAMLIRDGRVDAQRYDKLHLTPFGEVMPYISAWPWLERQLLAIGARGMSFTLSAGTRPVRWDVAGVRLGAIICFEGTMPRVCRTQAYQDGRPAVDALVSLTNDGWFGSSDHTRRMHLQATRWRCVELGIPIVRAANTGISCLIDTRGSIVRSGLEDNRSGAGPWRMHAYRTEGILMVNLPAYAHSVPTEGTWFGRYGMIVPMWTMAWAGLIALFAVLAPATRTNTGGSGGEDGNAIERS